MTKNKILGLIAVIVVLSTCIYLADSSYVSVKGNPLPAAETETPTPTPTAEPTVTPTPTPRPTPSAKPEMNVQLRSTAEGTPVIEVSGTLTYNKTAIPNASVYISCSSDNGANWENFTLVKTQIDGGFSGSWIPNGTGTYLVNAQWEGNWTLHWINATVNVATTSDSAGNNFSAMSNSTISNFTYDEATQKLSFNTNGTSSTTGYMYACLPKALLNDAQAVQVTIDGKPITFTVESEGDVWVISCVYSQSQHAVIVQIPFMQVLAPNEVPWVAIVVVIAVVIAAIAAVVVIRRRHRTAATVAAILKEDRPVF